MNSFEFFKEKKTVSTTINGLKIEIPHDWRVVKLRDIAKIGTGRKPPLQKGGDVPVYGKSLLGFTTKPMIESGKVIVMGNFPQSFSPKVVKAPIWVTAGFLYIAPREQDVLADYIKLFLEFVGMDLILPSGANIPRISAGRLGSLDIPIPPFNEQKAIVEIFKLFDEVRETGKKTIDLINKLKRASIDTMFLKLMEKWPKAKVGDVATLVRGASQVTDTISLPIISAAQVSSGIIYLTTEDVIEVDKKAKAKTKFKPGEILYVRQNPKLDRAVVSTFEGFATADVFVISVDKNKILPEYLALILHSSEFLDYAERVSSGTILPRMAWKDLSNFKFPLPPVDIQKNAISGVVKLDELERLKIKKLNLLNDLRSYLLNTLITGKVRVSIE